MPVIILDHDAEVKLTAWTIATSGKEFSGLGWIRKEGDVFHVTDVVLLGVGSEVYTEFSPARQRAIQPKEGLKLWFHRHPISGWSGTDEHTATREPLGAPPELVQWSVAIVRTPAGWIGRVDLHVPKTKTYPCKVEPSLPSPEIMEDARQLLTPELNHQIAELLAEYETLSRARFGRPVRIYSTYEDYDQMDFGVDYEMEHQGTGYFSECCGEELQLVEEDQTANVYVKTFMCPRCETLYNEIVSDFPEVAERQVYRPAPRPRRRRPQRDWRRSFDSFWNSRWNKDK